jgi:hypothetical protein
MIDLAEAWCRILLSIKYGMCRWILQALHIGETERGAWEDKKYDMVLVQMVLFQIRHRNATPKHV